MNLIRRASASTAATAMAALITITASACGGATTATGTPTNGLEKKSAAEVPQDAAGALGAAKSVQIVLTPPHGKGSPSQVDLRIQGDSRTLTFVENGIGKAEFTIIGQYAYVKINPAVFKVLPLPPSLKRISGRWLRIPAKRLKLGEEFSLASLAAQLTHHGPLEPAVRQATLNGRKVVVITDQRNGAKLYVANTGPAYPLLIANPDGRRIELSDYGANFHITAPSNAILAR
ncbi:MAG TPA: hypothetical protein VF933_02845 [Streptosporangiaceae bacterium]